MQEKEESVSPGCPVPEESVSPGCPVPEESVSPAPECHPEEDETGCREVYLQIEHYTWLPAVKFLAGVFQDQGHEIRVVGGAVRDIILYKTPKDIDLCTTATPQEMVQILNDAEIPHRETGIQHGTVTIYKKGFHFEMTSLRMDTIVDGRKVCLYGRSFKEDANRRDLTINAMSLDVKGRLYDYFSGMQNLTQGKLRFVEDATARVTEDPLRILRYFRFISSGMFSAEECPEEYKVLFTKKRSCLADPSFVAGERIWKEMGRVLASPTCCETLDAMKDCKILGSLGFPDLEHISSLSDLVDCSYTVPDIDTDVRAAAVLGLIFKGNSDCLVDLCNRWKVSNKVREISLTAAAISSMPALQDIKELLYHENPARFQEQKQVVLQIAGCDKASPLSRRELNELEEFDRPVFPFTKDHFARVPEFRSKQKDASDELKSAWIESGFALDVEEMVGMLREMVVPASREGFVRALRNEGV